MESAHASLVEYLRTYVVERLVAIEDASAGTQTRMLSSILAEPVLMSWFRNAQTGDETLQVEAGTRLSYAWGPDDQCLRTPTSVNLCADIDPKVWIYKTWMSPLRALLPTVRALEALCVAPAVRATSLTAAVHAIIRDVESIGPDDVTESVEVDALAAHRLDVGAMNQTREVAWDRDLRAAAAG